MGTVVSIVVRRADPLAAAQGLDAAFGVLRAADARFSPFDPGSELSRLDRGELAPDAVSRDMREVLAIAERARAGGAVRVSVDAAGRWRDTHVRLAWLAGRQGRRPLHRTVGRQPLPAARLGEGVRRRARAESFAHLPASGAPSLSEVPARRSIASVSYHAMVRAGRPPAE